MGTRTPRCMGCGGAHTAQHPHPSKQCPPASAEPTLKPLPSLQAGGTSQPRMAQPSPRGPGVTRGDCRTPATLCWPDLEAQELWEALEQSLPITGIYTGGYLSTSANLGIIAALAAIGQRLLPQTGREGRFVGSKQRSRQAGRRSKAIHGE